MASDNESSEPTCKYAEVYSDWQHEDWYHGELTRTEAEKRLKNGDECCFLLRKSKGSFILSLKNERNIYHVLLESSCGYRLQGHDDDSFSTLRELVMHYITYGISDNPRIILGNVCSKGKKTPRKRYPQHSDKPCSGYSSIRMEMREGSATDITKCHWYGGKLTKKEVEARLGADECSTSFLVWQSAPDQLTLSTKTQRLFCHTGIINSPEGFHLDTSEMTFKTLTDLIGYYGLSGEPKISTGTSEFLGEALTSIGNFTGSCMIQLNDKAITIKCDGQEINKWLYSSIRQFQVRNITGEFSFISGSRGPYGVAEYVFCLSGNSLVDLKHTLTQLTGAQFSTSTRSHIKMEQQGHNIALSAPSGSFLDDQNLNTTSEKTTIIENKQSSLSVASLHRIPNSDESSLKMFRVGESRESLDLLSTTPEVLNETLPDTFSSLIDPQTEPFGTHSSPTYEDMTDSPLSVAVSTPLPPPIPPIPTSRRLTQMARNIDKLQHDSVVCSPNEAYSVIPNSSPICIPPRNPDTLRSQWQKTKDKDLGCRIGKLSDYYAAGSLNNFEPRPFIHDTNCTTASTRESKCCII